MPWIKTKDRLPKEKKYVLARHRRGTWEDADDQKNVNCVVVKLVRGISKKERALMKNGKLSDPIDGGCPDHRRSAVYKGEDEDGNNTRPYHWETFDGDNFFGQVIREWTPIPKPNNK